MGRLVPQDPKDEPASELLKKIAKEKESLIKEGKIKKQEPVSEIGEDEKPFLLPQSWEWIRLTSIVSILGDGIHGTPTYSDDGQYFFINGNNLSDGLLEIKSNTKKVEEAEYLKHKRDLNDSTVFVSINGTIGNVAFYNNEQVILGKSICYFNLLNGSMRDYLKLLIQSNYFREYAFRNATGTTIDNVSLKSMRNLVIPLPSIHDQNLIVAKANELFTICDALKARICDSQNIKIHLADAVVEQTMT
jgi:type I restriction enzyme, S subunit